MATYEELKEEFLSHAGVKGMRWGKRKPATSGNVSVKVAKPTTQDILSARERQTNREIGLQQKAVATYAATTKKGLEASLKAYDKAEKRVLSHPDAATSALMTKGEKVTTGIVAGLYGLAIVGSIASIAGSQARINRF